MKLMSAAAPTATACMVDCAVSGFPAAAGLNILGQHLKTDERTGYVITDVDRDYDPAALKALRGVAGTLRFRMLH